MMGPLNNAAQQTSCGGLSARLAESPREMYYKKARNKPQQMYDRFKPKFNSLANYEFNM